MHSPPFYLCLSLPISVCARVCMTLDCKNEKAKLQERKDKSQAEKRQGVEKENREGGNGDREKCILEWKEKIMQFVSV